MYSVFIGQALDDSWPYLSTDLLGSDDAIGKRDHA